MAAIGVIFGGASPEHDISILTGLQAARALADGGEDVTCLYWAKNGTWQKVPVELEAPAFLEPSIAGAVELELAIPGGFVERRRLRSSPLALDVVLNCCHGGPGEDGALAAMLNLAGIRVTGPGPQASSLAMDKLAATGAVESLGVPVIETVMPISTTSDSDLPPVPWVAKPRFGGSSIGVEAGVDSLETVEALSRTGVGRAGVIVQPFLEGWVDLNVSVRTHPSLEVSAIERPLREGNAIYDYTDKYLTGGAGMDAAPRELPAQIPDGVAESIRSHARTVAEGLGLTGAPRVDFLWDGEEKVLFCEVNPIPGAWGNHLWDAVGIKRVDLYRGLIEEALASRPGTPQWSGTSDGQALRMAGSISAKLS